MADLCTAPSTGNAFLSGTLNYLDCQAQSIGELGYQALSGPGSSVGLALTALLTVLIAIYGIRLLLGASLAFNEIVIGVLKIGIVLTIATSWSAYRVVIYDTVMHGPAEIVQQIGRGVGLAGSDGGLVVHLQAVDDAIQSFASVGSGRFDLASVPAAASINGLPPKKPVVADDYAFGLARTLYLAGAIGALGFVHIIAGMLLALAPLFAGALLFEATRGLFIGWLQSLAATVIGAVFVTLVLALQLGLLEPWLLDVIGRRLTRVATPEAPFELLVVTLVFAAALVGVLYASARLAFAIHLPRISLPNLQPNALPVGHGLPASHRTTLMASEPPTRAQLIADTVAASQRREALGQQMTVINAGVSASRVPTGSMAPEASRMFPLGQTGRRNSRRTSHAATRRNARQ